MAATAGLSLPAALELEVLSSAVVDLAASNPIPTRDVRWTSLLMDVERLDHIRAGDLVLADLPAAALLVDLAARGVAALVLRLDEGDPRLPASVAALAARHELPVAAVRRDVSLVGLAEAINRAIADVDLARLKAIEHVDSELKAVLAAGAGLSGLTDAAARLTGVPVALLTPLRRVVAAAGLAPGEDPRRLLNAPGAALSEVVLQDRVWAVVCAGAVDDARRPLRDAVTEILPDIVAIEVMRFSEALPAEERVRREFIIDLLAGTIRTPDEFLLRTAFTSFAPSGEGRISGAAMPLVPGVSEAVARFLEREDVPHLGAPLNEDLLLLLETPEQGSPLELAERLIAALPSEIAAAGAPLMALGPPPGDLSGVGRTLHEARETLTIARDLGLGAPVVTAEALVLERLLARLINDPELVRFVDATLRPLVEHDAVNRSQLVATLEAYLRQGLSKAGAARDIGVRRQSLYSRLQRIETLVGSLDDPEHRLGLELALRARGLVRPVSAAARATRIRAGGAESVPQGDGAP